MTYTFSVTYLKCQSCDAKINCKQCSQELLTELLRSPDVERAEIDLEKKLVVADGADEDAIVDALDDVGIFTN